MSDEHRSPILDATVERLGRRAAARSSRRSFLGKVGRAAVILAGGPALVSVLAEPASARVCGQSGVSPKCATFDCDATWGWCWYASGCCAGGELKKICDCCAPNTPNPRGYCPVGTKVKCIVESCGADPRLMTRRLERVVAGEPVGISIAISRMRYPRGVPIAVVADAGHWQFAAFGAALGRVVAGPVLYNPRAGLDDGVAGELRRLGVEYVKLVGPRMEDAVGSGLEALGISVERIGRDRGLETCSAEVAEWSRSMTGARRALAVMPDGEEARAITAAAAVAHAQRLPLVLGAGDRVQAALRGPRPVQRTYVVTSDPADAERFPAGRAITAPSLAGFAERLADLALSLGAPGDRAVLAPLSDSSTAVGATAMPAPLLLHERGSMDGAFDWLLRRRADLEVAYAVGTSDDFTSNARYELQSVINEFETHLLIGVGGQGLPVIPQPPEERPIGKARR